MRDLAKLLASTQVCSLIRSKGSKTVKLITLTPNDTIHTALNIFIDQEISGIPIQKSNDGCGVNDFLGILKVTDVLKYILKDAPESFYNQNIETLLERPIHVIIDTCGIKKALIIKEQLNLMKLLLSHWSMERMTSSSMEADLKHLLVCCSNGTFDVVTPSDLLRYILLLSKEGGYLRKTKADPVVTSSYSMKEGKTVYDDEDAWSAFSRLLDTDPFYLMAVLDRNTGQLAANLSAIDFLSMKRTIPLELTISMIRRPGLSLYSFICATRPVFSSRDLEPVEVLPHYTIADLIEKMAKLKVHQLWKVSRDRSRKPLGIVSICDVIQFLCKNLEQFCDIK